ncbi:MAG: ATP12 family protein [Alphaproteobacteria bacterium]|nr:ATP12 family protein [Alphaproteobacteria bacterium]
MSDTDKPTFVATYDPEGERDARLSKRFYKVAASAKRDDGFAIILDDRELKTPGRTAVRVPNAELGEAVAAEWEAQASHIDPSTMPRTRIVTTAIDRVSLDNGPAIDEIVGYAGTDLVCYRADDPEELVALQGQAWDPLLEWFAGATGTRLKATSGIIHVQQDDDALRQVGLLLNEVDPISLTALHTLVTLSGSAVIGLAMLKGHLDAKDAYAASRVDETFQINKWGEDEEAAERAAFHKVEFDAAAEVLRLLGRLS